MEPVPPSDRLAAVLAAASAPPQPHEFAGEESALAAFRARPARRRFSLRRAIGIKVTVVFGVTLVAGGVAVANILPSPFDAPIVVPPPPAAPAPRPQPEPPMRSEVTASPAPRPPRQMGTGTVGHLALCRRLGAKTGEDREQALRTAEFAPLVAAAGGEPDEVWDFCEELAEVQPSRSRPPDDDDDDDETDRSRGGQTGSGALDGLHEVAQLVSQGWVQ